MDEKYIVQFVTLLGGACVSIVMAYRVYTEQINIIYALLVLFFTIALFFILGRILRRVLNKIRIENEEREKQEQLELEKAQKEAEAESEEEVPEDEETESEDEQENS